jgi:ATP-dependent DNA helicase DinG
VVRKGRENYLCLLNFEEAAKRQALAPGQRTVALALIARWVSATPDGDISGVGFPAFLAAYMSLREITDRRGECIYAACPHYRTCFIERIVRRARVAPIVVANHALVIANAAQDWLAIDETTDAPEGRRVRYVFDEGHHLFDAADSGFAAAVSGTEMADLRRWVRGPERRLPPRVRWQAKAGRLDWQRRTDRAKCSWRRPTNTSAPAAKIAMASILWKPKPIPWAKRRLKRRAVSASV